MLLLAAAGVGMLAWYAPPPASDGIALPAGKHVNEAKSGSGSGLNPRLAALPARAPLGEPRGELFAPHSPAPENPAPSAVAPAVPPNPYAVAGTLVQDGAASVYLVKGDRVFEAKPGLELDGGYRVAAVAADHVVLIYLPLGARHTLPFNAPFGAEVATDASPAPAVLSAAAAPAGPAAPSASGPAKAAQLRWRGPESVRAGAAFNVALHISSEQQLRATPMQLRFEPELLESLGARAGKFFGQGSFSYRTNPEGTIFVGAAGRGAAPGADAELVVFTFRPRRAGTTAQVSLGSVALQDAAGRPLEHDAVSVFRTAIQ